MRGAILKSATKDLTSVHRHYATVHAVKKVANQHQHKLFFLLAFLQGLRFLFLKNSNRNWLKRLQRGRAISAAFNFFIAKLKNERSPILPYKYI